MKELTIEWRHYEKEGATCNRCSATGSALRAVVSDLRAELAGRVTVTLTETVLPEDLLAQSNMILFNGVPLEDVLENATTETSPCTSCACLTGSEADCRTVEYGGRSYEEIPAELILKAAYKVSRMDGD